MTTIENEYTAKVREICALWAPGSDARRLEKAEAWDQFEAKIFERGGRTSVIERCQQKFAGDYLPVLQSCYQGQVDDVAYQRARVGVFRAYAQRLFELGLLTAVFDDRWIASFAKDSLAEERRVLPLPPTPAPMTERQIWILCDPLRRFSWTFFEDLHREFGVGRLAREPAIFGGMPELKQPDPGPGLIER